MLGGQSRLRRCDEEIVAKVMDGEAVIINLATGIYYSMDEAGGAIWEMIEDQRTIDAIAAGLASRYDVSPERAKDDVLRIARELLQLELVRRSTEEEGTLATRPEPQRKSKRPYVSPQVKSYHDMEDLLALDPPTPGLADIPWKE